jgi:hypothetical protein
MSARSDKAAGEITLVVGWALLLAGGAILTADCIEWLQTDTWKPLQIGRGLAWLGGREPALGQWLGVQRIVRWIFDQALSVVLIATGLLVVWVGLTKADEADRRTHIERADV